jgi:hypothetical protein
MLTQEGNNELNERKCNHWLLITKDRFLLG